jgi:ABC-type sugar transport system ATPase subunit
MKKIVKSFVGVKVLHSVDLELHEGEVLALVGENGAGKSTLMKILMGIEQPNSGEIFLDETKVTVTNPSKALALGITMIHQELYPVPEMSIAENMYLGREISKNGFVNMKKQCQMTVEWLNKLKMPLDPSMKMKSLSISQTQMVEIAKALSYHSRILIMDEPTSAITEEEVQQLFEVIRYLKTEGIGVIYISHKLDELAQIADNVEILRDGYVINKYPIKNIDRQDIVKDIVGRNITDIFPRCANKPGDIVLEVKGLTRRGEFSDVNFVLREGEKLGIAGLMGAGRTELVSAIFGVNRPDRGEIFVRGKKVNFKKPSDAIKAKIALVPEDRKTLGLNLQMSICDNITMCVDKRYSRFGFLNRIKGLQLARQMISDLVIKVFSVNYPVENLSGGNQQKVVLAKWLLTYPDILLFDEPTRGIDVGAKSEIFELINSLVMQHKAVLVISSELAEIIGVTDRVLVMREGSIVGELKDEKITQENIMTMAMSKMA